MEKWINCTVTRYVLLISKSMFVSDFTLCVLIFNAQSMACWETPCISTMLGLFQDRKYYTQTFAYTEADVLYVELIKRFIVKYWELFCSDLTQFSFSSGMSK